MTRLYTEGDVRAMLVEAVGQAASVSGQPVAAFVYAEIVSRILSTATPVAAPDLSRLAEAVRDRDVVALARIEACTSCEETFTTAEQAAFDPNDNDHCPECGERGTLTTYYGDPQWRIREGDLGIHTRAEDGRFVAEFLDLAPIIASISNGHAPIIAASGTGQGEAVVRTCGDCGWCEPPPASCDGPAICTHPRADRVAGDTPLATRCPAVERASEPPPTCPLRTPRKEQKR